jgi:hypothetical protein
VLLVSRSEHPRVPAGAAWAGGARDWHQRLGAKCGTTGA